VEFHGDNNDQQAAPQNMPSINGGGNDALYKTLSIQEFFHLQKYMLVIYYLRYKEKNSGTKNELDNNRRRINFSELNPRIRHSIKYFILSY